MEFSIRRAQGKDIPRIIDLATDMVIHSISPYRGATVESIKNYRRRDLRSLYQVLKDQNIVIYVAEDAQHKFLGHVICMKDYVESSSGEVQGYIFDLSVIEEYQRSGIGNELMKAAEAFCQEAGMKYVGLNVTSTNVRAVNFYEKIGYYEERKRMIKVLPSATEENVCTTAPLETEEKTGTSVPPETEEAVSGGNSEI